MAKSVYEFFFGLGGHTVGSLQDKHLLVQDAARELKADIEKASAARQETISQIVGELNDIAELAKHYN